MGRRITVGSNGLTIPFLGIRHKEQLTQEQVLLDPITEINVLELYNGNAWLPVGVSNAKTVTTTYTAHRRTAIC